MLGLLNLLLALLLNRLALCILQVRLEGPFFHVRSVCTVFALFNLALCIDLRVEDLLDLLVLFACLKAFINVIEAGLLILLNALSNVLPFLALLKFFIFVVNDIGHLIHQRLYPSTAFGDGLLTLALLLVLLLHHALDFFGLSLLTFKFFGISLLFLFLVFLNHLHGSLSFFFLFDEFVLLVSFNLGLESLGLHASFVDFFCVLNIALLFRVLKHLVTH